MARHAYWVILAGTTPTAFRAATRETLLPTLRQLQRTQPDVTLRWFERGRIWESPEAARFAARTRTPARDGRSADWRPGGEHRDPRARFQLTRDQKRARFKARARRTTLPPAEGPAGPAPPDAPRKPWSKDRRRTGPPRRDGRGPRQPPHGRGGRNRGGGGGHRQR